MDLELIHWCHCDEILMSMQNTGNNIRALVSVIFHQNMLSPIASVNAKSYSTIKF